MRHHSSPPLTPAGRSTAPPPATIPNRKSTKRTPPPGAPRSSRGRVCGQSPHAASPPTANRQNELPRPVPAADLKSTKRTPMTGPGRNSQIDKTNSRTGVTAFPTEPRRGWFLAAASASTVTPQRQSQIDKTNSHDRPRPQLSNRQNELPSWGDCLSGRTAPGWLLVAASSHIGNRQSQIAISAAHIRCHFSGLPGSFLQQAPERAQLIAA